MEGGFVMPEVTRSFIRLPVHNKTKEDKTIRTINVSEDRGIKGIYSVERKIILTLLFDRAKGWTLKKAREWKKENMATIESSLRHAGIEIETIEEDLIDTDLLSEDIEVVETFIVEEDEEGKKCKKKKEKDDSIHHEPKKKKKKGY
jgi:hypothetical protein